MAKGGIIGNLRVNLGIDSAQFQTGLAKASKSLEGMQKKAELFGAAVGVAMAGAAASLGYAVSNVINTADKLGYVADRMGVAVESLQELRYAAQRSGMEVGNFDVALRRFVRRASEAALGTGAAKDAFKDLGISLLNNEGRMKSSEQLLSEVADAMQKVQNPADRLRLAFKMFDTDGAAMVKVLEGGSAGLAQYREEARNLGIVLSEDAVRGAQEFKNNLDTITRAKDGLVTKLTAHLLPSLEMLSEKLMGFVNDEAAVSAAADGIGQAFAWIARQAAHVAILIDRLRAEIDGLVQAGVALKNFDFSGAWQAWSGGQEASARMRDELNATLDQMEEGFVQSQGQIQRRISAAFGESGAAAAESFEQQFTAAAKKGGGVKKVIDPMVAEAARIFDATRTPLEQYQAAIARLNELLAAGAINQDTYNRAVIQAQDAFDQAEKAGKKAEGTFEQIGQSIAQTIDSAFQGLVDGSKKVGDVLKDLLSQLASMLANQAFKYLFSAGFGGGGGILGGIGRMLGFRANGGPVAANRPYIVGERGPELMVPNTSGTVVKNSDLTGGRQRVEVVVQGVFVDDGGVVKAQVTQMGQQAAQAGAVLATQQVKQSMPSLLANAQTRSM